MKIESARRDWNAAKNCALEKDKPPIERQPTNPSSILAKFYFTPKPRLNSSEFIFIRKGIQYTKFNGGCSQSQSRIGLGRQKRVEFNLLLQMMLQNIWSISDC